MVLDEVNWKDRRRDLSKEAWTQDFVGDAIIGDNMARAGFLTLSTIDPWDWILLCCGGCCVHWLV